MSITTKHLRQRHEKGERILDLIESAETMLRLKNDSLRFYKVNCPDFNEAIIRTENRIDTLERAKLRLTRYYFNQMTLC
jgi:hypothetical protein